MSFIIVCRVKENYYSFSGSGSPGKSFKEIYEIDFDVYDFNKLEKFIKEKVCNNGKIEKIQITIDIKNKKYSDEEVFTFNDDSLQYLKYAKIETPRFFIVHKENEEKKSQTGWFF